MKTFPTVHIPFAPGLFLLTFILSFVYITGGDVFCQEAGEIPSGIRGGIEEFANARDMMGSYVINPLDRLSIVVYAGEKQIEKYEEFVKSDGTVYLPFLERDVKISGLRVLEAEDILEKLARAFIKEPRFVITVVSSYSQSVSTYGKIASMDIEINTPMRILQLIAKAGGPQDGARADSIRVISIDGSIRFFDFEKVNKNPNDEDNFFLKPGDIIFVPGEDDFSVIVLGDVSRPGTYPMKAGGQLIDALVNAGSWGINADIKKIRILSVYSTDRVEIKKVNILNIFNEGNIKQNFALQDGDIVFVPTKSAPAIITLASTMISIIYSLAATYALYIAVKD